MMVAPHEFCGDGFDLDKYLRSQDQTKKLVLDFSKRIHSGMSEKEAHALLETMMNESGLEKRWHPTKMRMGPNTVKSFRDISEDYILKDNDIFFADIGPVYYNHEGDYGETFAIGSGLRLKHLADAPKTIFYATQKAWKDDLLTGEALYDFASKEALKLNLRLNSNMYGHRLGDFPHAVHSKARLGDIPFHPTANLWVLEIHVIDDEIQRGAFFEDILI